MNDPAHILVVDDFQQHALGVVGLLKQHGYNAQALFNGHTVLDLIAKQIPDLILLDVMMPAMDGYEVCQRIREITGHRILPIVMFTSLDPSTERIKGLEAGADDFLTKPANVDELLIRIRSLLRVKQYYDTAQEQAQQLADLNRTLEQRVSDQVTQLDRMQKLKRFFSPQLAEMIVAGGAEDPLKSHRREIVVVFLDLRGFTAFASTTEPEEVMTLLREYHAVVGRVIMAHQGTIERFTGDGIMVFFNDPVVIPHPAGQAVRMALAMQVELAGTLGKWRQSGYNLGLGVGMSQGYATIGAIGFEGRQDYGAIGRVTNLAARLCDEAKPGQVLTDSKTLRQVEQLVDSEPVGDLELKGFVRPISTFNVTGLKAPPAG